MEDNLNRRVILNIQK